MGHSSAHLSWRPQWLQVCNSTIRPISSGWERFKRKNHIHNKGCFYWKKEDIWQYFPSKRTIPQSEPMQKEDVILGFWHSPLLVNPNLLPRWTFPSFVQIIWFCSLPFQILWEELLSSNWMHSGCSFGLISSVMETMYVHETINFTNLCWDESK